MNRKLKSNELSRIIPKDFKESEKFDVLIILDNIRSGNNVGSIFRTSDALRINSIFLCGITAQPPHKDIHKTALGATDSVKWEYFSETEQAVEKAINNGYSIFSIEQTSDSIMLDKFKPEKGKKYALVLGNEVRGVQQNIIDKSEGSIEIPQFGTKHSFNVSVTTGIILWDLFVKINPFE